MKIPAPQEAPLGRVEPPKPSANARGTSGGPSEPPAFVERRILLNVPMNQLFWSKAWTDCKLLALPVWTVVHCAAVFVEKRRIRKREASLKCIEQLKLSGKEAAIFFQSFAKEMIEFCFIFLLKKRRNFRFQKNVRSIVQ